MMEHRLPSIVGSVIVSACCGILTPPLSAQPPRRERSALDHVAPSTDQLRVLERYGRRDARVHDPSSIVKCKGEYWLFATGRGIESWRSRDLQEWERGPRVFDEVPRWVTQVVPTQRGHFWAPDVIFHADRYWLYYSVSRFGVNTSAIGLASSRTLDPADAGYEWQDHGIVIRSRRGDDFNAIDPAVLKTSSGQLWLSFGSFWSGIKLIELDEQSHMRKDGESVIRGIAAHREIEAPHIVERDGYFYLLVNWGLCCRGVRSTYNVRVGRSRSVTGPYLDKGGRDMMSGGGTLFLDTEGPFIGPGHASVFREDDRYVFSCHFYDGTNRGRSRLAILPLIWSPDGWPSVAPLSGR